MNQSEKITDEYTKLIAPFQFLIAAKTVKNTWSSVGSCVLMKLDNRHFLVTATHVMNQRHHVNEKSLYLLLDIEDKTTFEDNSNLKTKSKKKNILIEEDIVCYDNPIFKNVPDSYDIAIIELNRSRYKDISDENFLTLENVYLENLTVNEKAIYAFSGYPNSKNKSLKQSKNELLAVFTELEKDTLFTVSLSYHKSNFKQMLPAPQGMSGGGVWIISNTTDLKPKLIGVSVCYKDKKHVVAVKISYVLSMVKGFFHGTLDSINLPFEHIEKENDCSLYINPDLLPSHLLAEAVLLYLRSEIMKILSYKVAEIYFEES